MSKTKELRQIEIDKELEGYVVGLRRHFHTNPELSRQEVQTARRVCSELEGMGLSPQLLKDNCVMVDIKGDLADNGKKIGLRADMDALSIQEENDAPYRSINDGVMHACGHDGHTAMLLGAARYLASHRDFGGVVRCLFQPSEETGEGATLMIKQGCLEGLTRIFAIHLWSGIELGEISLSKGAISAATGVFTIDVTGKGGHGSMPQDSIDAIVATSALVTSLQSIVSRSLDPMDVGVLTVGEFHAGSRFNIIAERAHLSGTTRVYKKSLLDSLPRHIDRVCSGISAAYGTTYALDHKWAIKNPCVNDSATIDDIRKLKIKDASFIDVGPLPIGEDMGDMLDVVDGALALVGSKNSAKGFDKPHHHACFDIDERALKIGCELHIAVALGYLG